MDLRFAGHPLVVAIADYIRAADGSPTAILVAIYSLDSLQSFSAGIARAQGVTLMIADRSGTLLSSGGSHGIISVAGDPRVRLAETGHTGLLNYAPPLVGGGRGPKELSAYTPVATSGWTVLAEVPDHTAFAGWVRLAIPCWWLLTPWWSSYWRGVF